MKVKELKGRAIVPGNCRGRALVSTQPLSFLGDVNPNLGTIIKKKHDLYGKEIKGQVLCFPYGHGSTVGSYVLYSLARKGVEPKAIVNQKADPVVVVGAIIAEIPMIDQIDVQQIKTGDEVEVDGGVGIVRILRRK
ncbi:MAG: DUF126 domain-containing protein [Thermoproteota archaeon]|nr:DUF126 domain-containing protein [Thermoproteota archaeon]